MTTPKKPKSKKSMRDLAKPKKEVTREKAKNITGGAIALPPKYRPGAP
jgi:hypothetical protein